MELRTCFLSAEDGDAFPAPPVFIFSQWVRDIAYKSDLLNGTMAARSADSQLIREVWAQAIRKSQPELATRECFALARQARAADRLVSQWLDKPDPGGGGSNWQRFLQWRTTVQQILQTQKWFTPEDWLEHFCTLLRAGKVAATILPESVQLTGFVETTRLERAVIKALGEAGVRVKYAKVTVAGTEKPAIRHFTSLEQELASMVCWARMMPCRWPSFRTIDRPCGRLSGLET